MVSQPVSQPVPRRGFKPEDPNLDLKIRALQRPNTFASVRIIIMDWVLIFVSAITSWQAFTVWGLTPASFAVYILAFFVIGSRQKGLENLMHEGTHHSLSPSGHLNDLLARWFAGFWIYPGWHPQSERPGHVGGHHGHFGDLKYDLEYHGYRTVLGLGQLPAPSAWESLRIFTHALLRTTWWRINWIISKFRFVHFTILAVITAVLWYSGLLIPFFIYWILPYLFLYIPMRFLAEVSEHMGLEWSSEFATTRNKLGWVQEHIVHPHGDGLHLVHHLYPQIPHQNLTKAHQLLMQDPVYREKGNHCYGLFLGFNRRRTTLGDLLLGRDSSELAM